MTTPDAKRIADKYIGPDGGAPHSKTRWKRPGRIGGVYLEAEGLRHVAQLFDFLDVVAACGPATYSRPSIRGVKNELRERAVAARKSLADLIGATEDDLRSEATIYLRQHK
ncbi:hypothetical+protein [Methylocapsa aurea]|uniref:hypothetical protein n=1 Tax=Methylocapsa aurea TaxID=663610 RepID=UPI003D188A57